MQLSSSSVGCCLSSSQTPRLFQVTCLSMPLPPYVHRLHACRSSQCCRFWATVSRVGDNHVCNMRQLRRLDISENKITHVSDAVGNLVCLEASGKPHPGFFRPASHPAKHSCDPSSPTRILLLNAPSANSSLSQLLCRYWS